MYKDGVWLARKASTGCLEVAGPAWGWYDRAGVGLGESDLRRVYVICRLMLSLVVGLGFHGEERKDLTFRSCRGGVGRGSRVGGRDWAWWSGKTLELIDLGIALRSAAMYYILCLVFYFRLVAA